MTTREIGKALGGSKADMQSRKNPNAREDYDFWEM
jgi:hypothetical protein